MRIVLFAAAAAAFAMPAAAQVSASEERIADRLADPLVQEGAAAAVSAVVGTILDTRIGPLARWTDPDADIRPGDTLRDLKRRDDPNFERRLYADTRRSAALLGSAAGDMVAMLGELRRTAARLEGLADSAAAVADRYDGPYDDDY